jgi:hypothetical protein
MFIRRKWPLLLLTLLSFAAIGVIIGAKPAGYGYFETSYSSPSPQLLEEEAQVASRSVPTSDLYEVASGAGEPLVSQAASGAGDSLTPSATPAANGTAHQGESAVPAITPPWLDQPPLRWR